MKNNLANKTFSEETASTEAATGNRLLFPGLGNFYNWAEPVAFTILRVGFGLTLLTHGIPKFFGGAHGTNTDPLAKTTGRIANTLHLPFADALSHIVSYLEVWGALMLAAGILTRIVAPMIAVEMACICIALIPTGFVWTNGGYEYALLMGFVALLISIKGGGKYSVDRLIGREL
jgi:putative oxidoreductase